MAILDETKKGELILLESPKKIPPTIARFRGTSIKRSMVSHGEVHLVHSEDPLLILPPTQVGDLLLPTFCYTPCAPTFPHTISHVAIGIDNIQERLNARGEDYEIYRSWMEGLTQLQDPFGDLEKAVILGALTSRRYLLDRSHKREVSIGNYAFRAEDRPYFHRFDIATGAIEREKVPARKKLVRGLRNLRPIPVPKVATPPRVRKKKTRVIKPKQKEIGPPTHLYYGSAGTQDDTPETWTRSPIQALHEAFDCAKQYSAVPFVYVARNVDFTPKSIEKHELSWRLAGEPTDLHICRDANFEHMLATAGRPAADWVLEGMRGYLSGRRAGEAFEFYDVQSKRKFTSKHYRLELNKKPMLVTPSLLGTHNCTRILAHGVQEEILAAEG